MPYIVVPHRHHIAPGEQHPVQRLGGGDQFGPVLGIDDALGQSVHRRILDADDVARGRLVGSRRTPIIALLIARRLGLAHAEQDHVEVTVVLALVELRIVDYPHRGLDADALEILDIGQGDLGERIAGEQDLHLHHLASLHIGELAVLELPPGLLQEADGCADIGALDLIAAIDGIGIGRGEHLRRQLVLERFEDVALLALRQPAGGEFVEPGEIGADALILVEEDRTVQRLEIEDQVEGLAHPDILEFWPPQVEGEGLHAADGVGREILLDDAPFRHRRDVVERHPVGDDILQPEVVGIALEQFRQLLGIGVVVVADLIEIIVALGGGQIGAPPVLDPLIDGPAPGLEALEAVGAGTERRLERGVGDVARLAVGPIGQPPMLGHDVELAEDLRQLAIALGREAERHLVGRADLGLGDVVIILRGLQVVGLLHLEGPHHVLRRQLGAVVPARLGIDAEGHRGNVVGKAHRIGDLAIFGGRFVLRRCHQVLVDIGDTGLDVALHRDAVDRHQRDVEIVEGAADRQPHPAALGRIRIDVVEMVERLLVPGLAQQGDADAPG